MPTVREWFDDFAAALVDRTGRVDLPEGGSEYWDDFERALVRIGADLGSTPTRLRLDRLRRAQPVPEPVPADGRGGHPETPGPPAGRRSRPHRRHRRGGPHRLEGLPRLRGLGRGDPVRPPGHPRQGPHLRRERGPGRFGRGLPLLVCHGPAGGQGAPPTRPGPRAPDDRPVPESEAPAGPLVRSARLQVPPPPPALGRIDRLPARRRGGGRPRPGHRRPEGRPGHPQGPGKAGWCDSSSRSPRRPPRASQGVPIWRPPRPETASSPGNWPPRPRRQPENPERDLTIPEDHIDEAGS